MIDDQESRAVVLYVGRGRSPFPKEDLDALTSAFGSEDASMLSKFVRSLLLKANKFRVDWTKNALVSGTKAYEDDLRRHHPELSDAAIAALAWTFSYHRK